MHDNAMSMLTNREVGAVVDLVREVLGDPRSGLAPQGERLGRWKSFQTLDIIFGVEHAFNLQFTSEGMETIEDLATLLTAIAAARERGS